MIATILINGALGFGFLLALLFSIGDVDAALNTKTGFPIIEIFYQAIESKGGATAMISVIIAMASFATLGSIAAASRTLWAFARDNGLPYSAYFAHVSPATFPHSGGTLF